MIDPSTFYNIGINPREFCDWLEGYLDGRHGVLNEVDVQIIRGKLEQTKTRQPLKSTMDARCYNGELNA